MPGEPVAKSDAHVVVEACGRAARVLGLSMEELSAVVGKHRMPALLIGFLHVRSSVRSAQVAMRAEQSSGDAATNS